MYMYTPGSGASTAQYPYQGTLIHNNEFPRISRNLFLSTPNWNTTASKDAMFEYQFNHTFNKYINFK